MDFFRHLDTHLEYRTIDIFIFYGSGKKKIGDGEKGK